jgi:hypothetical protein
MATITTYATLVDAVSEYLAREQDATLAARVPTFIQLFEAKMNRTLLHPKMETRSTTTCDTSDTEPEFISLPTDFQSMRRVRLSGVTGKPRLNFMTQTQIDDYRYSIDNVSDQPVNFSIMGDEMELAPTPNENFELEMVYRANIPALTSSNTTNWLLTLAPDLYLYGVLLESAPYTKEDSRIGVWGSAMATVLDQLNMHGNRQSFDSGPTTVSLPGNTP